MTDGDDADEHRARSPLPRVDELPTAETSFGDAYLTIDGDSDEAESIRTGRVDDFSIGFDAGADEHGARRRDLADLQREYSFSVELEPLPVGRVVEELAVEELLDGDEYHAVSVTDESKGELLYHVRDMVRELREAGYLRHVREAGAIVASTQADEDEPTAMQLIRDAVDENARVVRELAGDPDEFAVDGVTVYPADELPSGVVAAVAVDALAPTPPGTLKPFFVRDRRGVEVANVEFVGEA